MKKNLTLILFGFLPLFAISQIQQAFNYQAAVRNSNGEIQFDTTVSFKIEILQNGNVEYSENHFDKETGKTGVVNFKVGDGEDKVGDFSSIDWSQGNLKIRTTLNGEPNPIGIADIVAVPIALYAENSGDSHWMKTDTSLYYSETKVGLGTNNPTSPFHIHTMSNNQGLRLSTEGISESIYLHLTETNSGVEYGYLHLGGQTSLRGNGRTSVFEGRVGIGTNVPQGKLHINSNGELIRLQGANNAFISFHQHPNSDIQSGYIGYGDSDNNNLYLVNRQVGSMVFRTNYVTRMIISNSGNIGIGITTPDSKLHVNGRTKTTCLEITGGCDIKEDLNSIEKLEPGDIVVIDEKNPGQVRRTDEEYDRKVAGIISGANGINPGISLSQEDVLEGEYPLTMLGRVYVKVTGNVEIGDMLTTSSTAGYAMSVKDFSKANGTVIGKAMTKNENGEGMVLVLVNLQ